MNSPKIVRPKLPKGYADNPASFVDWEWVAAQLTESKNYWLCSVRPPSPDAQGGRPHVVPRWGALLEDKFYYDGSPETRHARNITENPHVSLHLESGSQVIIMEGTSQPAGKPEPEFAKRLAEAIGGKYGDQGYFAQTRSMGRGRAVRVHPAPVHHLDGLLREPDKIRVRRITQCGCTSFRELDLDLAAAVQPGPFQTYIISQSLAKGWRKALPAALAPLVSDPPIIALCLLALSQVPAWFERLLYFAGGSFVIYLAAGAYRAWRTSQRTVRPSRRVQAGASGEPRWSTP
ncbi:MAG: LysE family transporter [Bacillus subtilis]|nr:LysE family transporter [Bacillus subtilis]